MEKERARIATSSAPAALGPYSQAVAVGEYVFTSGQIALDPRTGVLIAPDDAQLQTEQVLRNLEAVLAAAGTSLSYAVKSIIFLTNMGDFEQVNDVYAKFVDSPVLPARSTVEVAKLPKGARVEIEVIALKSADVAPNVQQRLI